MTPAAASTGALRCDAARNRERVLDAAARMLAMHGLDVSMQQIAAEAGVGVGTVFRRFSSKEALVAAVADARMRELVELVRTAADRAAAEPWPAFVEYFVGATALHVRNRGLLEVFASAAGGAPLESARCSELLDALGALVERVQAAGALRRDVGAQDLLSLHCAISHVSCMPLDPLEPEAWRRHCGIVLDGLRAGHGSRRP